MSKVKYFFKKLIPISIVQYIRKLRYSNSKSSFINKPAKETFNEVYKTNFWGSKENVSGTGSELIQTQKIVSKLNDLFKKLKIGSMLDLPCGNFSWMEALEMSNIQYIGGDIVDDIIENNRKKSNHLTFKTLDLIKDDLPIVDIIFNRDCLVHLSYENIFKSIENIKKSKIKYLITTTFTKHYPNYDIVTGDWRALNFEKPPFNFPAPILLINEGCSEGNGEYSDKCMGLWEISKLP